MDRGTRGLKAAMPLLQSTGDPQNDGFPGHLTWEVAGLFGAQGGEGWALTTKITCPLWRAF